MIFNIDLLNWFGNFINFLILAFIAINIVNTQCFNLFEMSLSLIGLLSSIFIQIVSMVIKENLKRGRMM
ncbi:hypothetical protein CMI38_01135 [Candidatus Pacearchaeota archaeon]|jgi:hypothetical protein|nr:hypothetical protein [Candidatus Pacearchaeota archaeon]